MIKNKKQAKPNQQKYMYNFLIMKKQKMRKNT